MASTSALEKEVKDLKAENKRLQKIIDDRKKSMERGKQSSFSKGRGGGASSSGMGRGGGQAGASTAGGNKVTWASIVDGHCWAYNNGSCVDKSCPKKHVCSRKVARDTPCNQPHPKKDHP